MTNIPLRAYTREIEGLVEHEQRLDEAIEHCRQILKTYPKHLETYRLLGKAYLEGKRYDQAVDIFERLLVAVPDDFVAHVGMSIIADDQGKLDDAIWHMERAFEVQPSNAAIQGELQRLFGRRDGAEPPKIRLTRGALAHMYVQGQLYAQAISEIRAVLAQDADRTDLQVLLAKAYFHSGQKNEAADVCAQLLSRYPYCFDANGLMVDLLAGTPSAESAPEYRQRVNELEPYAAFTQDSVFTTASVPENAVMVERLEYVGKAPQAGPLLAAGLSSSGAAQASPWNALGSREQPDMDLPPFLRGASSTASRSVGPKPLEGGAAGEAPLPETPSGDLPAWVRALAPTDDDENMEDPGANPPEGLAWLRSEDTSEPAASSALTDDIPDSETPAWLRDLGSEIVQPPVADAGSTEPGPAASQDLPMHPSDGASLGGESQEEDDGLAWLESLAAKHGETPDQTKTSVESARAEPPSWVDKAAEIGQQAADAWTAIAKESGGQPPPAAESSGALAEPEGAEAKPQESPSEQPPAEAPPVDWFHSLAELDSAGGKPPEASAEEPPAEAPPVDWFHGLAELTSAGGEPPEASAEEPPAETPPAAWFDNLSQLEGAGANPSESSAEEPPVEAPPAEWFDNLSQLDRAGAKPPVSSAEAPPAEAPPSDWLHAMADKDALADEADAGLGEVAPTPAEGGLSEWPKMTPPPSVGEAPPWLGAVTSEADASAPIVSEGLSADSGSDAELPDWLSGVDKEKSSPAAIAPSEGPPPWLRTESQQAPQAPEITTPEDWRPAESAPSSEVAPARAESGSLAEQPGTPSVPSDGVPAVPQSGPLPRPAKPGVALLGSAQSEMGRGNIAAALDIYGRLIHRGKSLTEIIRDLRDALNRYPVEVPLWQALGDAYMRSNKLQEALDAYTKAEELLR